eukprot:9777667-Alexandrium_andersonii.AAC.1
MHATTRHNPCTAMLPAQGHRHAPAHLLSTRATRLCTFLCVENRMSRSEPCILQQGDRPSAEGWRSGVPMLVAPEATPKAR